MSSIAAATSPLGGAADWLLAQAALAVLAVTLGLLLARASLSLRLHWSWALPLTALGLIADRHLPGAGPVPALAAMVAGASARRRHRRDLEAGADLAELAAERLTLLDGGLALARSLGARSQRREHRDGLMLGRDARGRAVRVPFAGGGHTLVVGATGSGKTVTQTALARWAIESGQGAVIVDPKGDETMRLQIRHAAAAGGRRFVEWSPGGDRVYNPFARGSDTEIADKLLAGERFTEPHYMRQAQRYLGHAVRALRAAGREGCLREIVELLDPDRLELLARTLPTDTRGVTHDYLDSLTARQRRDIGGVRDRLAILAESDVGRWLDPGGEGADAFDLLEEVAARSVVYFSLEADSRPLLSQMLGAAIVQDLQTAVAALQSRPTPTLVVIDEFSALATEQVVRLFARARSAGFSLLLGTQELSDLRLPGREWLLEQILGNLSLLIAHRQVVPGSAELIAGLCGRRGVWRVSAHGDGRVTRTRAREGALNGDRVMGLPTGWAAVIGLTGEGGARIARISPPAPIGRRGGR